MYLQKLFTYKRYFAKNTALQNAVLKRRGKRKKKEEKFARVHMSARVRAPMHV